MPPKQSPKDRRGARAGGKGGKDAKGGRGKGKERPKREKKPKPPKPKPKPKKPDDPVTGGQKWKLFFSAHWRGVFCLVYPIILLPLLIPFPGKIHMWVAYALCLMGGFWVTECIPLPVTAFFPLILFPLRGVANTNTVSKAYMNDSIMLFLGSLFLAASVEQSGYHKRLAYFFIRVIGYSHVKLLLAVCIVTTFVSMWITNTAATVMMIPIIFALLKVFEDQKILKIYKKTVTDDEIADDLATCYFCAATFSATVGGIGTLVGTATNLVFKGLFMTEFPNAPEYLSFPLFSAFSVPYMICLEICVYLYLAVFYLGLFRPKSAAAKRAVMPKLAQEAAKKTIQKDSKALGRLTYWEFMVILLFGGAMIMFFCRYPQIFPGWGDLLSKFFKLGNPKFIADSALAMLVSLLMLLLPSNLSFCKNFKAKYVEDLPTKPVRSVLDWLVLNEKMPYAFMFLLGGGFALSQSAKSSGLNDRLGILMKSLQALPNEVIILMITIVVVFVTNFASNVAVCNVFAPIAMSLATNIGQNPLWYVIVAGFSASYCFMIPVGTPGNLVVQSAAKVSTSKMMIAGLGPTITTILLTWLFTLYYAPLIWPLRVKHAWHGATEAPPPPADPPPAD